MLTGATTRGVRSTIYMPVKFPFTRVKQELPLPREDCLTNYSLPPANHKRHTGCSSPVLFKSLKVCPVLRVLHFAVPPALGCLFSTTDLHSSFLPPAPRVSVLLLLSCCTPSYSHTPKPLSQLFIAVPRPRQCL